MGKRSLKTAARAGAAVAVAGVVAERARRTARTSGTAVATTGVSAGRAAKQLGKRVSSGFAATVRTAASEDAGVWADKESASHEANATPTTDDALALLADQTQRAQQARVTAAKAAFEAGAEVSEIARAAGERRHTIKEWLADS